MKPHDITLRKVLNLLDSLDLFENVTHRKDDEHGYVISFQALDIMLADDGPTVEQFELPLVHAYWYAAGVVNGTMWLHNMQVMGAERNLPGLFGST
jgi:hypothetical protein